MGRCCAVNARRITAHRLRQGHGLAESRPSVLKGDRLFIRESGRGTVEYEGVVHYVGDKNVSLGLSDKLVSKLNSARCINSWDVRFSFSLFTHDTMHRAVKMAAGLPNLFFPFADSLRIEPIQRPIEIECFDDRVSTNPEQLAAVPARVAQTSGSAPLGACRDRRLHWLAGRRYGPVASLRSRGHADAHRRRHQDLHWPLDAEGAAPARQGEAGVASRVARWRDKLRPIGGAARQERLAWQERLARRQDARARERRIEARRRKGLRK